ncbi:MAG: ASPIC/UnbV domain-containing protein [Flavobacteriales bacterium]|nr:ASPIC/UnbV domain-containing protein [Flavobacteriales bacterium]
MLVGISDSIVGEPHSLLYQNTQIIGNWLKVGLVGLASNRDGFGARVSITFNGRTLIREVDGGSSFNSHHSSIVHFGLGNNVLELDVLKVIWPGGYTDEFYNVPANQHLIVTEQSGFVITGEENLQQTEPDFAVFPNPTTGQLSFVINSLKETTCSLRLYDQRGRLLSILLDEAGVSGTLRSTINLPDHIVSGMYNLVLADGVSQKVKLLQCVR